MPFQTRVSFGAASALVITAMAVVPTGAFGQTFDVKLPEVKQGSLELGFDNTLQGGLPGGSDANRSGHDLSIDYGVRDWWRLSGVLRFENPQDDDFRLGKMAVENLFVLKPVDAKAAQDFGLGWFTALDLSVHPDTANALIFGPIVTVKSQKLSLTANPFLEQTFGRNQVEGIALNYGWQAKYEVRDGFAVGIEGFGVVENLGHSPPWSEQEHRIGPAIFTEIEVAKDFKISPDIGLLFGLTSATPDVALKLNIGVPLHQR
jgi:hypothetical protein